MLGRLSQTAVRVLARNRFVTVPPSGPLPFAMDRMPSGRLASFGPKNPDRVFYVIWRAGYGSGFFSNVSLVLCHLAIADAGGFIPVVDFEHFPTLYNEDEGISGTRNAWEYYFRPVSDYPLEDVYQSRNVFFCDGMYPSGFNMNVSEVPEWQGIFDRYVTVRPEIEESVTEWLPRFGARTLGVHFRGKEQNIAPGHPFGPTPRQIIDATTRLIRERNFDRVFLVTEDQRNLDLFRREFGDLVVATDCYRTGRENAYRIRPRSLHRYLLGREVLVDALLLSRCQGLITCGSNVTEFAKILNGGKFESVWRIHNGSNSTNPLAALYLHGVRRRLPPRLGGLPGRIIEADRVTDV